ncbi:MAG: hypothetical protein CMB55_07880 [Euryarchaeota archaeon]|nr:hypothetical protein [Euryarchaeota archaeon]
MTEYDNNLSGALFRNKDKFSNDGEVVHGKEKHPDYTGNAEVDGIKYNIAGWMQKSQKGMSYMKLKLSIPQPQGSNMPSSPPISQKEQPLDDEIPF